MKHKTGLFMAVLMSVGLAGVLAGCQSQPQGASFMREPLRQVKTERDRQYVWCIANDPFFRSPQCQELQGGR
ncbi:MAG: hypothetical protein AAGD47_12010 [Pseudomonadota bacterium]